LFSKDNKSQGMNQNGSISGNQNIFDQQVSPITAKPKVRDSSPDWYYGKELLEDALDPKE
jgi:hypothetical protein